MPSWNWVMPISAGDSGGIYQRMQRNNAGNVRPHYFQPNKRRAGGYGLFIYIGERASQKAGYPHVTIMLEDGTALQEKGGSLFFSSREFHASTSDSFKIYWETDANGQFQILPGQSSQLGSSQMIDMGNVLLGKISRDMTNGISPAVDAPTGAPAPVWQAEAVKQYTYEENEAWARQFEWPDEGY